jgi:hypothetical protein
MVCGPSVEVARIHVFDFAPRPYQFQIAPISGYVPVILTIHNDLWEKGLPVNSHLRATTKIDVF